MEIVESGRFTYANLFWDDLSAKTQNELLNLIGDNGNYDVFPIAMINVSGDDDDDIDLPFGEVDAP